MLMTFIPYLVGVLGVGGSGLLLRKRVSRLPRRLLGGLLAGVTAVAFGSAWVTTNLDARAAITAAQDLAYTSQVNYATSGHLADTAALLKGVDGQKPDLGQTYGPGEGIYTATTPVDRAENVYMLTTLVVKDGRYTLATAGTGNTNSDAFMFDSNLAFQVRTYDSYAAAASSPLGYALPVHQPKLVRG